jgi:predicted ester cyclase
MQNKTEIERNKSAVGRFNREVIELGNASSFRDLMDPQFIDRMAPAGAPNGPEGMLFAFNNILRPAFPDLKVVIHEQIAEGDKVTTRKTLTGTHRGELFGIAPTNRAVSIEVIDIVRLKDGRYIEHWGINTMPSLVAALQAQDSKR